METLQTTAHENHVEMIMVRCRYSLSMLGVSIYSCKQFVTNRAFLSLPGYMLVQFVIQVQICVDRGAL